MPSEVIRSVIGGHSKYSLVTHLTILFGLAAFVSVVICNVYLYLALRQTLRLQSAHMLLERLLAVRSLVQDPEFSVHDLAHHIEKEWAEGRFEKAYVRVFDDRNEIVAQTPDMTPKVLEALQNAPTLYSVNRGTLENLAETAPSREFLATEQTLPVKDLWTKSLKVEMALDRSHEDRVLVGYRNQSYFAIPILFLLCGLVGLHVAKQGIQPIFAIAQSTERFGVNNLSERIPEEDLPVEIQVLARNFNSMLVRLEDSFDRMSRFSADIAHELGTPLNNMRGEIEVLFSKERPVQQYREALSSCLEECSKMERIISSLIFLAQAENPRHQLKKETVNLKAELEHVLEFYEASATEAGVRLSLQVSDSVQIHVERTLFHRAVGNLLANAIRHTPPNGSIVLKAEPSDRFAWIHVMDTGDGIPQDHIPYIFERFYRVDKSRSKESGGLGLGLALVQTISNIHGGQVQVHSRQGVGTTFDISFPLAGSDYEAELSASS